MYDLIIIGGSAVATAAGVYAARRNLNFKVISGDWGGEVATSGEIENYPGFIHTDGVALAETFRKHLETYRAPIEMGVWVENVKKEGDHFIIATKKDGVAGVEQAKAVIIGTGVHPRELNVPGEKEFRAKGVTYCTVCDGPLFKGKTVAVIGGGNSANEAGIMLAGLCPKVYIITKNPAMKGEQVLIDKLNAAPNVEIIPNATTAKILGEQTVNGLEYLDSSTNATKRLDVQGVFVHVGMVPNSTLVPEVEKNAFGEIKVNQRGETNIPGLFAAGDVTDIPFKQIAIATGQGVVAALQATSYLNGLK